MTDREKLIELIDEGRQKRGGICYFHEDCSLCKYDADGENCGDAVIADHLLANGVTVQRWIPVTERLPKEQGYYLVAHQRSGCVAERFYYRDCPDLFVKVTGDPVTHWMPLPEPPKEGE